MAGVNGYVGLSAISVWLVIHLALSVWLVSAACKLTSVFSSHAQIRCVLLVPELATITVLIIFTDTY